MPLPPAPKTKAARVSVRYYGDKTSASVKKQTQSTAADKTVTTDQKTLRRTRRKNPPEAVVQTPVAAPVTVQHDADRRTQKFTRSALINEKKSSLFVLDTNVLLHDPMALFGFAEHDIFLPLTTLEELDNHKKGVSDIARYARQVSRILDQLIEAAGSKLTDGIALSALGHTEAQGKLFFQTKTYGTQLPAELPQGKADNVILCTVLGLKEEFSEKNVVLVSKDINMRIKATAIGLAAEDYLNDKTIEDSDILYTGHTVLENDFWNQAGSSLESWSSGNQTWYRFRAEFVRGLSINEFITTADGSFVGQVKQIDGTQATVCTVEDYLQPKNDIWGIHARNLEQSFALNLLMDPDIDFVTLLGHAGTGKTLLTLAAALTQTLDRHKYSEIIFTRATVSVGDDIGYLPGTEEEKMAPWMGALEDNLEALNKSDRHTVGDWGRSAAADLVRSRIKIKSMSFMRGRTFHNKFVIIDEAQNLSPKQMKTLITRAGPGTKIVCLGNIAQIDTPYLTEGSSGLTYVVERFKGWEHAGHITLQRGERSRLADWATDVL